MFLFIGFKEQKALLLQNSMILNDWIPKKNSGRSSQFYYVKHEDQHELSRLPV